MRSLRTLGALALVALLALAGASPAAAKKKPKAAAFAAKYHLTGSWKNKDADKDGLKNLKEFKLGTNPKAADTDKDGLKDADEVASGNHPTKRDSDRDGIKDGAEHAGVVTAFDGETVTVREFATGKKVTATLDTECSPADVSADDSSYEDEGFVEGDEDESFDAELVADAATAGDEEDTEDEVEVGDEEVDADAAACDAEDFDKGAVFSGAEYESVDGTLYLVEFKLA